MASVDVGTPKKGKLMDRYNKAQIYLLLLSWNRAFVFCETFSNDIVWGTQQSGFSPQAHTIRAICLVFFLSTLTLPFILNVSERKHEKGTDNDILLQQPQRAVPLTTKDII